MLHLTVAQMRRSIGRLTAAGIAILISTAFITATLIAGNVLQRTTVDSIAAAYADADLVVRSTDGLTTEDLDALRTTPGVAAADPVTDVYVDLVSGSRHSFVRVVAAPSTSRLAPLTTVRGAIPSADDEIALNEETATRFGLTVGDQVTLVHTTFTEGEDEPTEQRGAWNVVGIVDDPYGAYARSGGAVVVPQDSAVRWAVEDTGHVATEVTVALAPGTDIATARTALLAHAPADATAVTPEEHARATAKEFTGDQDVLVPVVLAFAGIALVVAGLVITNTFQVLVAQRTRQLALLRTVGARRSQLARSVLLEATLLGLVSSLSGILIGVALTQAALMFAHRTDLGVPLPSTVPMNAAVVLVPLLAGTLVTVVACFAPARAATRVSPLEALRPADAPTVRTTAGRLRLWTALILTLVGVAFLGLGLALRTSDVMIGVLAGVVGGALSFVGVLVGAVFWIPTVVSAAGKVVAGSGTSGRLAAANTLRNPRRTAATSTALLIGVTLVAMMSTGAASARLSLGAALDDQYPVDVDVSSMAPSEGGIAPLPRSLHRQIAALDGIGTVAVLSHMFVTIDGDGDASDGADLSAVTLLGGDPRQAARATRTGGAPPAVDDSTVLVDPAIAGSTITDGDVVTLAAEDGRRVRLTARLGEFGGSDLFVTPAAFAQLTQSTSATTLWIKLADVGDAGSVVPRIQDLVSEAGGDSISVSGAAVERAAFQQVIDTLLAVVVGLLAVAVVIALIGVANTLSLSVLERRRESATLRAIGLTRRQLRWTLAIEGMLIAGVGAVLGLGLGLLYGWAGAATLLATMGDITFSVPWQDFAMAFVVAVLAGLLASVIPGRAAARTSPVEALAVD